MKTKPIVCIFEKKDQPYSYLYIDPKTKNRNSYLFYVDQEFGGINFASIPNTDLNPDPTYKFDFKEFLGNFLIGAFYKNGRELIICTANTHTSSSNSSSVNILNNPVYKINSLNYYNVHKKTTQKEVIREDLYFSPEIDLTKQFPFSTYNDYNNVLDNNNKLCWNKELIRPFARFIGTPCVVVLQGNIEALYKEPEIIYLSKFVQQNPFDLNFDQKDENDVLSEERECRCELIFPPVVNYEQSSHIWTVIKTKEELKEEDEEKDKSEENKIKKYYNEAKMDYIYFNIQNKFDKGDLFEKFKLFKEMRSKFRDSFSLLYSDTKNNHQKITFYLIGNDILQLADASLLYSFCYICDFQDFSTSNLSLFSEGTNSKIEIPIKKCLFDFLTKCVYNTMNVMNNGEVVKWSQIESKAETKSYYEKYDEFFRFQKYSKSVKFSLDPLHIILTYFKSNDSSNLIKLKAHFQEEFVVSQVSIKLRHRDPSQAIMMQISFDEDTICHHLFCPEILLPNPDKEEVFMFNLSKIARSSLLYPVDFKCFQKTRFITLNFTTNFTFSSSEFQKIIGRDDVIFIVKRPISKTLHYEIVNDKENENDNYRYCECLDNFVNKGEMTMLSILNYEMTRVENAVSDYHKCIYMISNNTNPVLFDFRTYLARSNIQSNQCPFCNTKLPRNHNIFYEINPSFPLFILQSKSAPKNGFAVCENCHREYVKENKLDVRSFLNQNKKNLANINEYLDVKLIDLPYVTEPMTLVSQNSSVYRYSPSNLAKSDISLLFTKEGSPSGVSFAKELSILIFFQSLVKVEMNEIVIDSSPPGSVTFDLNDPYLGRLNLDRKSQNQSRNNLKSLEIVLKIDQKDESGSEEVKVNRIQVHGSFLPSFILNSNNVGSTVKLSKYSLFDCKSKFDDKFKTSQTLKFESDVIGYRIQIKRGQFLTSIVIAYFDNNQFVGSHFIMLPYRTYNETKVYDFPAAFTVKHDSVRIFYLDRQLCDGVNVKIITKK